MLLREFTFKVKDNKYQVRIPNPGQLIQIETEKALATNGVYRQILFSDTLGSVYALDVVDMHAYFAVLVPALLNDIKLKGTNIHEMDLLDFNELRNAYKDQFIPWVNSWMSLLSAAPKEIDVSSTGSKGTNTLEIDEEDPITEQ